MKNCPNCNQIFSDDYHFCLDDGTTLLYVAETGENSPVFSTGDNATTQVLSRPQVVSPKAPTDSSKWLYLIIGVLATALAGAAIFMFVSRNASEKGGVPNQNSKVEQTSETSENANQAEKVHTKNTAPPNIAPTNISNPIVQPKVNPNLNPSGSWAGHWNSKSTYFTAQVSLTDDGAGKVNGQIIWTLQRTTNPKKINKVGTSATEYVQGTFNPTTRMLSLRGYRLDDPNQIVVLDRYNLVLAESNQTMSGTSKSSGKFVLRR